MCECGRIASHANRGNVQDGAVCLAWEASVCDLFYQEYIASEDIMEGHTLAVASTTNDVAPSAPSAAATGLGSG